MNGRHLDWLIGVATVQLRHMERQRAGSLKKSTRQPKPLRDKGNQPFDGNGKSDHA